MNLTCESNIYFYDFFFFFPEGRLTRQAEWGWAGNNGRMGRVGETTASSHQHRCRYRIVVVCYRAFQEHDNTRYLAFSLTVEGLKNDIKRNNGESKREENDKR